MEDPETGRSGGKTKKTVVMTVKTRAMMLKNRRVSFAEERGGKKRELTSQSVQEWVQGSTSAQGMIRDGEGRVHG